MRKLVIVVALGALSASLATGAAAQRAGMGRGMGVGGTGQNVANMRDQAQMARERQMLTQQQNDVARAERQKQFEAAVQSLRDEQKAIRDKATAEMRELTLAETQRIAAIDTRIQRMETQREQTVARVQERVQDAREDAARDRQRSRALNEGDCQAAGGTVDRTRRSAGTRCGNGGGN